MNDRIRELAEQARKHFPKTESSGEFWVFDEAKFAQLIVKECISVPYAMWDRAELNADVAVKIEHRIRDHLGMEE